MKHYIDFSHASGSLPDKVLTELSLSFVKSLTDEDERAQSGSWIAHENKLLSFIEQGDISGIATYSGAHSVPARVGYDVYDELLQARYILVSTVTLLARAAIRGGMNENESFMLGDAYLQMSARLRNRDEVLGLVIVATTEYTKRVHEIKTTAAAKYSPAVALCLTCITEHIHENITLEELSKACGFSREHLSRVFRRETGTTVKKYYLRKKMELAAYLLLYSKKSILDIAYFLGFSSHGRFSGYFRQQFGTTPKAYRRNRSWHSGDSDVLRGGTQ